MSFRLGATTPQCESGNLNIKLAITREYSIGDMSSIHHTTTVDAPRLPGATDIWLDCDTGHDDAFAILIAAHHLHSNLLGISTTYGNAPLPQTTYNTRAILKAIGREDVPVYMGADRPFCREIACAPDIHGETGLDGTTNLPIPSVPAKTDKTAIQAMYDALSNTPPKSAWVVATGALTNVALLFSIYPGLADHIAGLSIMGGAVGNGFTDAPMGLVKGEGLRFGNWTPWAEFNIYIDPESARAVFDNPVLSGKTILVPLDLTHQFLATEEVQDRLLYGPHRPDIKPPVATDTSKLFNEILMFFAKTYAEVFGITAGPPLHDPLAVATILAPGLFDNGHTQSFDVKVVTDGEHGSSAEIRNGTSQCGRTLVTPLGDGRSGGVRIPRTLDKDALWQIIEDCLDRAELTVGRHEVAQ